MVFRTQYGDGYAAFHGLPKDSDLRRAIADKALTAGFTHPQDDDIANLAMCLVQPELDRLQARLDAVLDLCQQAEDMGVTSGPPFTVTSVRAAAEGRDPHKRTTEK